MKLVIDNREIEVQEGATVLEAAQQHNICIPHLCAHPELTTYGGCRICIVEIEGMKGYPTACTARAKEGMIVRTNTDTVLEMRREIIQLILSEHPSGCLICGEKEECAGTMETIRKVGATTGCRWCAKDGDCELQKVVQHLQIEEIEFPVYYQDLEVEKYDPFFDRDYNLCIYCARCVRICEEHRKSFVLALNERGKKAFVGPAFHNNHIEAECEFCGACVSVCPTGAISEKNRKWAGVPSSYRESVCPICSLNCDIQIATKKGRVIGTFPPGDPHESGGELCVKGRFCLAELVNHPDRVLESHYRFPQGPGIVSYEDAVAKAAEQLKKVKGERTAFYLSPNLTLEELAAVKIFAGQVIDTPNITSSVLDENLISYLPLINKSASLDDIEKSDALISLFLRGNYAYAPVTLRIKRAAEKGVPFYQVGWTKDTTSRFAEQSIIPTPGKEKNFFKKILQAVEKGSGGGELKELVNLLKSNSSITIILGPEIVYLSEAEEILQTIEEIAGLTKAKIFAPNPHGNLFGLLSVLQTRSSEEIDQLAAGKKIDLLYIIGDSPFETRPEVDFIIHQASFPPPEELKADLVLPAATWSEISGSYAGSSGKIKKFKAVVTPPDYTAGNQEILADIVRAMGIKEIKFTRKEIADRVPKNLSVKIPQTGSKSRKKEKVSSPDPNFPYLLIREKTFTFHNVSLSKTVAGMAEIVPAETLLLHPLDAAKLGLNDGDNVIVESADIKKEYPLKLREVISPGFVLLISSVRTPVFKANPCPVHLRRKNV